MECVRERERERARTMKREGGGKGGGERKAMKGTRERPRHIARKKSSEMHRGCERARLRACVCV